MGKLTAAISEEKKLVKSIKQLDTHMETVANYYKPGRFLWYGFLRGIVYGLGILVAFAVIIPLLILLLSSIQWVPLIGDFVGDIIISIQDVQPL